MNRQCSALRRWKNAILRKSILNGNASGQRGLVFGNASRLQSAINGGNVGRLLDSDRGEQ